MCFVNATNNVNHYHNSRIKVRFRGFFFLILRVKCAYMSCSIWTLFLCSTKKTKKKKKLVSIPKEKKNKNKNKNPQPFTFTFYILAVSSQNSLSKLTWLQPPSPPQVHNLLLSLSFRFFLSLSSISCPTKQYPLFFFPFSVYIFRLTIWREFKR